MIFRPLVVLSAVIGGVGLSESDPVAQVTSSRAESPHTARVMNAPP